MHLDVVVPAASDLVKDTGDDPVVAHDAQGDSPHIHIVGILNAHRMPKFKEVFLHRPMIVADSLANHGGELVKLFFRFHIPDVYSPSGFAALCSSCVQELLLRRPKRWQRAQAIRKVCGNFCLPKAADRERKIAVKADGGSGLPFIFAK